MVRLVSYVAFYICMLVVIKAWSDMVYNVDVSCAMRCVWSVASMRSIQDFFSPFAYVCWAGGPGYSPFSIYQFLASHMFITQFALIPTVLSSLFLYISVSPILGYRSPILAFQSPQMVARVCGGMCPKMSSTAVLISSSLIPRVYKFVVGGVYTFPIQMIWPPCPYIPTT
jgi:hypothetical protein